MKKILLAILTTLLIFLTYIILAKSISIAGFKIESITDIKQASQNLEQDVDKANSLVDETYPKEKASLEEAIRNLKIAKQEYESKNVYNTDESELSAVHVDTYKIHFLWTKLGNYRKDRNVRSLSLDLKSTETANVYDLQFTLIGTYSNIIEFLYDIEDDEELNFEPRSFLITSDLSNNITTQETTNTLGTTNNNNDVNANTTTVKSDGINLKATFTVENVGITLD